MLKNIHDEIDLSYISTIIKFEVGRPVWMLKDVVNSKLVLKREESNYPASFKESARLLGAISKSTRPVTLTDRELDQISHGLAHSHYKNRFGNDKFGNDICTDLLQTINRPGGLWIKLPFVNGLTDLECVAKNFASTGDKSGVRAFAEALNRRDGCEKLGELLAFDLFVGNRDRCSPDGGGLAFNGYQPIVLVNVGNLFASADDQGELVVRALDTFDPNADFANWDARNFDADFWCGKILKEDAKNAKELEDYAKNVVTDINVILGPRNRTGAKKLFGATTNRLDKKAAKRVLKGMHSGLAKVKQKVMKKIVTCPPGITGRAAALGWPQEYMQ